MIHYVKLHYIIIQEIILYYIKLHYNYIAVELNSAIAVRGGRDAVSVH